MCYLCRRKASKGDRISLHKFPKNPVLRNKWIQACDLSLSDDLRYICICSLHFDADNLDRGNQFQTRCTLKSNAVPSIGVPNNVSDSNNDNKDALNKDAVNKYTVYKNTLDNKTGSNKINSEYVRTNAYENDNEINNLIVNVNTYGNVIIRVNPLKNLINNVNTITDVINDTGSVYNLSEEEHVQELQLNVQTPNRGIQSPSNQCDDFIKDEPFDIPCANVDSEVDQIVGDSKESCYPTSKRRFHEPRYISEIRTTDFVTPGRIGRILNFVRDTDKKKSKIIKALRDRNRKLEKRICSLRETVAHLKKKYGD